MNTKPDAENATESKISPTLKFFIMFFLIQASVNFFLLLLRHGCN